MSHIIIHAMPFTGSLGELKESLGAILKSDQARANRFHKGDGAYGPLSSNPLPGGGQMDTEGYDDDDGLKKRLGEMNIDLHQSEPRLHSSMDVTDSSESCSTLFMHICAYILLKLWSIRSRRG